MSDNEVADLLKSLIKKFDQREEDHIQDRKDASEERHEVLRSVRNMAAQNVQMHDEFLILRGKVEGLPAKVDEHQRKIDRAEGMMNLIVWIGSFIGVGGGMAAIYGIWQSLGATHIMAQK